MTTQKAQSEREKLQSLNLAKECYAMKMDLLTNTTVIDDGIRFIAVNIIDKEKMKESKESNSITMEKQITANQTSKIENGLQYLDPIP